MIAKHVFDIDSDTPKPRVCEPQDVSRAGDARANRKRPEIMTEVILRNVSIHSSLASSAAVITLEEINGAVMAAMLSRQNSDSSVPGCTMSSSALALQTPAMASTAPATCTGRR
jgi:hypothetical protein